MSTYRPKQRSVAAEVHTSAGWISGTFLVPPIQGFLDFVNQSKGFMKVTNAVLPDKTPTPFFALRRSAIQIIIPDQNEPNLQARTNVGAVTSHRVRCLLIDGVLEGTLEIASNLRVSDYLAQHSEFIALRECFVHLTPTPDRPEIRQPTPFVIAYAGGIIGVSEREAS